MQAYITLRQFRWCYQKYIFNPRKQWRYNSKVLKLFFFTCFSQKSKWKQLLCYRYIVLDALQCNIKTFDRTTQNFWPNDLQKILISAKVNRHRLLTLNDYTFVANKLNLCPFYFERQRQWIHKRNETLSTASLCFSGYILLKFGFTYTWNYAHFVTTLFFRFYRRSSSI